MTPEEIKKLIEQEVKRQLDPYVRRLEGLEARIPRIIESTVQRAVFKMNEKEKVDYIQ